MTINYALHENNLTSDPGDYIALVQPVGTAELGRRVKFPRLSAGILPKEKASLLAFSRDRAHHRAGLHRHPP
jgi:hypothetical protein